MYVYLKLKGEKISTITIPTNAFTKLAPPPTPTFTADQELYSLSLSLSLRIEV